MEQPYINDNNYQEKLTRDDVDRLLQNPTADSKAEILKKVSSNYRPELLSDAERDLAEQIFRLLVHDSAIKIRSTLATNLKDNPHVPKDIILKLAQDEESVSTPVLKSSEVLDDIDLVNIIRNSEEVWRYLAITKRPTVSEQVSDALINVEHRDVTASLLDNHNAKFSQTSYDKLTSQAANDSTIAQKIANRPQLPIAVVEKLSEVVSRDIAEQLEKKYNIDKKSAQKTAQYAKDSNILELISRHATEEQTIELVEQLHASGRLSSSIIINALCHGNVLFFEVSLSVMAGIPLANARLLIADKGKLGFRALYNKAGLPSTMFRAVRLLLNSVNDTINSGLSPCSGQFSNNVVRRMLEASQGEKIENLSYILALLRQQANPSF